jgi:hypothetical protein
MLDIDNNILHSLRVLNFNIVYNLTLRELKMINLDDLTLGQIKELKNAINGETAKSNNMCDDYPVGKNVIVRTVTMIYTGLLYKVTDTDLVLLQCSWIPQTEKYKLFVETGAVKYCEPYPDELKVFVNRGALVDFCELVAKLPRSQK